MAYINGKEILFSPQIDINAEYETGYNNGHSVGRKAEYDEFWDAYQNNGSVWGCESMFGSEGWKDSNFKPKYSMRDFKRADSMFKVSKITNIKKCLEDAKVVFSFSNCTNFQYTFAYCATTALPVIDMSKATNTTYAFYYAEQLESIDGLIPPTAANFDNCFYMCAKLENLSISGTIATNGLDLQWSTKLSKASIESIIEALDEKATGKSITLSKTAVDTAFYHFDKDKDGSDTTEWKELIAPKTNAGWIINLV